MENKEKNFQQFFEHTLLGDYELADEHVTLITENTLVIKKWNWDYEKSLLFQRHCVEFIQHFPHFKIFIICNHPEVLTHGRGLQRPKKGQKLELIPFQESDQLQQISYPLFQIERGGGLTFHHPGQFIFYPILKLNPTTLSLSRMTEEIFNISIDILSSWGLTSLSSNREMMGLWYKDFKLASMGIAIKKLTTFHGMALNLLKHPVMMKNLQHLNPCGINILTYKAVNELITPPDDCINIFAEDFIKRICREWK